VLLVLLRPEGAGVAAAAERSQRCRKQLALGQPPESRNKFQSFASFLFLALLKLSTKNKNSGRLPSVSTNRRAIALLFVVAASLQQRRNVATTLASASQRRELK